MQALSLLLVVCLAIIVKTFGEEHSVNQISDLYLSVKIDSADTHAITVEDATEVPTASPTFTPVPSVIPTAIPTFIPTAPPTRRPTQGPTRRPTQSPSAPTAEPTQQSLPIATFNSVFTMTLSSSNLTSADKQAITDATATTLSLPANYVTFVSASFALRRMLRAAVAKVVGVHTTSVTGTVTTKITVPLVDYPSYGTNSSALVSYLSNFLTQAVASGNYSTTLQDTAVGLGLDSSSAIFLATVSGVAVDDIVVTAPPEDDDDSGINSRLVLLAAGVAIAGIIFVALIAAIFSLLSGYIIDQEMKKKQAEKNAAKNGSTVIVAQDQDVHEVYNSSDDKAPMQSMPRAVSGRLEMTDSTAL